MYLVYTIMVCGSLTFSACLFLQCDGQLSLDAFFDSIRSHPVKIGVIGCGCSVATEPVAAIIHFWNIPLVWPLSLQCH